MADMNGELRDVSKYIKSGEFKPEYCEGRLDRLIKLTPTLINDNYEDALQIKLKNWQKTYNEWLKKNNRDTINIEIEKLSLNTKYQYSYIIDVDEIYDVYRTDTDAKINGNEKISFFIRVNQNGDFIDDKYHDEGWIINNCGDYKNSKVQNIYEK